MEQDLVFSPDGSGIPVTKWRDLPLPAGRYSGQQEIAPN